MEFRDMLMLASPTSLMTGSPGRTVTVNFFVSEPPHTSNTVEVTVVLPTESPDKVIVLFSTVDVEARS